MDAFVPKHDCHSCDKHYGEQTPRAFGLLPVLEIHGHDDGGEQCDARVDDDPHSCAHEDRTNCEHDDEITQPCGVHPVSSLHHPHERQKHAIQVHADVAGFGEQELWAVSSPWRVGRDVFAGHELAEPVANERDVEVYGEELDDTYRECNPVHGEDDADHVPPVELFDAYGDLQGGETGDRAGKSEERPQGW